MNPLNLLALVLGKMPASDSPAGTLNKTDALKLVRLALVAAAGVFLSQIATGLTSLDFGSWKPLADLAGILLVEIARRLAANQQPE